MATTGGGGSLADIMRECRGYTVTLETYASELPPNFQALREELVVAVAETDEAGVRQAQYTALVQQATADQDAGRLKCRDLATRIRNSLRGFYGPLSEALNKFGIRPRRFTPRTAKTKPPEVETSPPQAATPGAAAAA